MVRSCTTYYYNLLTFEGALPRLNILKSHWSHYQLEDAVQKREACKDNEFRVVFISDAVVEPLAMMIKAWTAPVAAATVLRLLITQIGLANVAVVVSLFLIRTLDQRIGGIWNRSNESADNACPCNYTIENHACQWATTMLSGRNWLPLSSSDVVSDEAIENSYLIGHVEPRKDLQRVPRTCQTMIAMGSFTQLKYIWTDVWRQSTCAYLFRHRWCLFILPSFEISLRICDCIELVLWKVPVNSVLKELVDAEGWFRILLSMTLRRTRLSINIVRSFHLFLRL